MREDILRRLALGEFTERFPSELELTEEYDVSRYTVREALRRLRQDGIIDSSRGRQPVARQGQISQELGALYSLFRELESRGIAQHSVVRVLELRTSTEAAARLELPAERELVYVERVRLADQEPLALDRAWLPADLAEPLLDVDLSHTALYDALHEVSGARMSGGRESIEARLADEHEREAFGAPDVPFAVLAIDRMGFVGDRLAEWRQTVVRGDRFRFAADWGPEHGYQVDVGQRRL